jgi:putative endonuclease
VLYRNFRTTRGGEVDLVCRDKRESMLVFVEVKTRSTDAFGEPSRAVTRRKQLLIERGARSWLRMLEDPDVLFRFDVVEIVMEDGIPQVNLIKNAFEIPEPYRF